MLGLIAGFSITEDEAEVISRVVSGEKEEFRKLVLRYQEQIYRMMLRQTGDSGVAKDLAQETFLRAFQNLSSFRGEASFSTWITRIAINLANNYFKSRAYRERSRITLHVAEAPFPSDSEIEERLLKLREFIGDLKPIYRNVVVLCGLERKSYEEASEILSIPIGTVRSRLNTARTMLKERFSNEEK